MRYLVTGAAGFIGSHLAEALAAAGHEVVGIDCFTDYYDPAIKERNARGLDVRRLDLAEDELDFTGFDGVFHLAGQPGVRSFGDVFPLYVRRNVLASQRVFEAAADARRARRLRVVVVDLRGGRALSDLGGRAAEAGLAVRDHEAHLRAPRPGVRAQLRARRRRPALLQRVRPPAAAGHGVPARRSRRSPRAHPFTLFGDGEQSRSFTYVGDVVEASVLAMQQAEPGAVYNVGGGEEATMNEAIALLEQIAGRPLDVRREPAVPGDQRRTKADTTRIEAELGWRPRTRLEEGLAPNGGGRRYPRPRESRRRPSPTSTPSARSTSARSGSGSPRAGGCPSLGLVLGLVVGFLLALGGGTVYRAEALLFLGQPFTPQGGGQIQSLATNPRTVGEIIRSESALRAAARESGLTVSQLRGNVASTPITTAGQSRLQTPLVEVSVKGNAPAKVAAAANALAERVVERVSLYVDDKVQVLDDQIANDNRELEQINTRIARATQQQTEILENEELVRQRAPAPADEHQLDDRLRRAAARHRAGGPAAGAPAALARD